MPKNPQRGKYKAKCDHRQLQDALLEVKNETMNERAAAKSCGVPCFTLKDRIGEKVTQHVVGRPLVIASAMTKKS